MKHKSSSPHVHMLMGNHGSNSSHPESILMKGHSRQHHFAGGISAAPPKYAAGGGLGNPRKFAKGGHCYAEGGEAAEYGEKPLTGQLRRGGRAKREHHYMGGSGRWKPSPQRPLTPEERAGVDRVNKNMAWAKSKDNPYRNPLNEMKKGGRARRKHHAEGGSEEDRPVSERQEHRKGGRTKRQHHAWGQEVWGRIPLIGDLARDISRTVGTLDENKFGGANYTPKSKWESLGNLALTGHMKKGGRAKRKHHFAGDGVEGISSQKSALSPQAGAPVADNSVRQAQKKGGRSKRQHHAWGQNFWGRMPIVGDLGLGIARAAGTIDPKQFGGDEYVADTPGKKAADIMSHIGNHGTQWALNALKKGGRAHHRQHHAEGGSGKVRKGMMTESGHMIHHER